MRNSSLIGHVCELLDLIRPLKQPADSVVKDFFRTRHYLGSKDRRFISETIYGILRHYKLLHTFAGEAFKSQPGVSVIPLVLYTTYAVKINQQDKASILSDVESSWRISFPKSDCAGFIAALDGAKLPQEILDNPTLRLDVTYSFPESIVEEWIVRFGEVETENLCRSMNQPAPIVVRVNTLKTTVEECRLRLEAEGIESEPTNISPVGLTLKKRINAPALKSYKNGLFEIQDEGSQLISYLLKPQPGEIIVDACAGGGGKTVHIAALMKNEGELHSMDVDEKRLNTIRPRLVRAGVTIAQLHLVRKGEESLTLKESADAVLVDAPCSGVGTFRRNPGAKLSFREEFVEHISKTQQQVLSTAASLVKPGGRLVYSTCTLLRKENEDVVEGFLAEHPDFKTVSASDILKEQNISLETSSNYLTLLPYKTNTDGFFAAVFRKNES